MQCHYLTAQEKYLDSPFDLADEDIRQLFNALEFDRHLSFGKLYRQNNSTDCWFVDENNITHVVSAERVKIITQWDKQVLLPDDNVFEKLKKIGGTPPHIWNIMQQKNSGKYRGRVISKHI